MFSEQVPEYTIDLAKDENRRWDQVIESDGDSVRNLMNAVRQEISEILPGFIQRGLKRHAGLKYIESGGHYVDEMRAWADALGRPFGEMVMVNCSYELSHVLPGLGIFGCTAGIVQTRHGLVHVRNLDWGLQGLGEVTRMFRFKKGRRTFLAVGVPGYVGVLSGMVPKSYSVTINWAPPSGLPSFDWGPAFLLRHVLETCDTYEGAVHALSRTPLATSVFYTVCGAAPSQACVIERTKLRNAIRKPRGHVITHANHFLSDKLSPHNTDPDVVSDSMPRVLRLRDALFEAKDIDDAFACLDIKDVLNDLTEQQMAFCPKTGEVRVCRWAD
jgi:predicted choloylglycine hydrolase